MTSKVENVDAHICVVVVVVVGSDVCTSGRESLAGTALGSGN